jgi:hypothetical protein
VTNPYRIHEADLNIPEGWEDRSLTIFRLPGTDGAKDASLVITRDPARGKLDFSAYIVSQVDECKEKLPGFVLYKNESFKFQDHVGAWLEYSWKNGNASTLIRQVFYDRGLGALIFTLTLAPGDVAHFDPIWRGFMSSMTLQPLPRSIDDAPPFPPPAQE